MTNNTTSSTEKMRQEAEQILKTKLLANSSQSDLEPAMLKVIHELEVHQIELVMQNDELLLAKEHAELASEKYTMLYDFAPNGYFTLSRTGKILQLNLRGAEMLNKDRVKLINSSFALFVSNDTKALFSAFLEKTFLTNVKEICEVKLTPADNMPSLFVHLSGISIKNSDEYMLTAIDVTLRKTREDELKKSEERYRGLLNILDAGVVVHAADSAITMSNPKAAHLLGLSEDELRGKKVIDPDWQFLKEDGTSLPIELFPVNVIRRTIASIRDLIVGVHRPITQDTVWLMVNGYPVLNDKKEIKEMVMSFIDITEQRLAENSLKESYAFNLSILNCIADPIAVLNAQGEIVSINEPWNTMSQKSTARYLAQQTIGSKYLDLCATSQQCPDINEATEIVAGLKSVLSGEHNSFSLDYPCPEIDAHFWYNIRISPMYFDHTPKGAIVTLTDITERKKNEMALKVVNNELKKQTKELAESNAELEQFAYVASHDLQEPLRMVTSFLSQLEKKYSTIIDETGKRYIEFAVDGARRMRQIILDLLEFSRIGRNPEAMEDINLGQLINEIKILLSKRIKEKDAVINTIGLPTMHVYRAPLMQVFQNLISNALMYSKKDQTPVIEITAQEFDQYWQFAVADNGIGINADYFDKIFVIFQRLHTHNEFPGTGMGLALTKKIIENMGGRIWVSSEEEKGSTFYFTIFKKN